MNRRWKHVIGILGGLGPAAHIALEQHLLRLVSSVEMDQDYPPWVVSSLPQTPDRTLALQGVGASPVPCLVESLRRLEGPADFAVMACNTAHAFLPALRAEVRLPILDVVREVVAELVREAGNDACVGLLATTGTLLSCVYPETARSSGAGLSWVSLRDLPGGDLLQQELVMQPVYGKVAGTRGGVKAGYLKDPETGRPYADQIRLASEHLIRAGATVIVLGCTEIPLALHDDNREPLSVPLVDPMKVAAKAALRIAGGEVDLPHAPRVGIE